MDGFALDAQGWPIITPPSGSRIIYVSSSTGNNNNNGLSPETPVQTIAAGLALLQNNSGDELLLKAGDTFVNQSIVLSVNGESPTDPIVIGTYGSGPAPVVETAATQSGITPANGNSGNNIVVEGIDFYSYQRDPNNPAYAGPNNDATGANFVGQSGSVSLSFVGDTFDYYSTNIAVMPGPDGVTAYPGSSVTLYRDIVENSWSTDAHSQGVFIGYVANPVIEQTILDHNGWNAAIPGAGATIFNHNVYLDDTDGPVVFTGNISANSSTDGVMSRSGGTITDNLFVNDAMGPIIGVDPGSDGNGLGSPVLTSADIAGNVVLEATAISTSGGPQPMSQGVNVSNSSGSGVQIVDNIFADPNPNAPTANEAGIGINSYTTGINATDNVIYGFTRAVLDQNGNNTTSPNAIDLTGYVNPNVSVESYNASLGGSATLAAFMAAADSQTMTNWNAAYTAAAVDSYIQAGFATMVTQVTASPSSGSEVAGDTITITMDFGQSVTVVGAPTLSLNDRGTATYAGGSGTSALTFSYTIGTTDIPVSALAITAVNLPNGATIEDEGGNPSDLSNALVTFAGLPIATPSGPRLISIGQILRRVPTLMPATSLR